jgi:hypothetical protein
MSYINWWSLLSIYVLIILSSSNVIGLNSMEHGAADFENGITIETTIKNQNLTLDQNKILLNNWIKMSNLSSPSPRYYQAMIYDSFNQVGILFGGMNFSQSYNDTWTYNAFLDKWIEKEPLISPSPRAGSAIAYDSQDKVVVLFGGLEGNNWINDTWLYNLTSNTWTNMSPIEAPPVSRGLIYQMAYDPIKNVCVVFGGGSNVPPSSGSGTWTYSVNKNNWIKLETNITPLARTCSAMVYDESNHIMVLFGGYRFEQHLNDTWILDLKNYSWSQRWPSVAPSARTSHAMVYDSNRGVSILFGGDWSPGSEETWAYNSSNNSWLQLTPAIAPMSKEGHQMEYDRSAKAVVLFGGWDRINQPDSLSDDTWIYWPDVFYQNGTYTSKPKDLSGTVFYGTIEWNASNTNSTSIDFQLRTADTQNELLNKSFIGPDGMDSTFYNQSGQHIASIHNGSRWIQLKAYLSTQNILETPQLQDIEIHYNLLQHLSISSPLGAENWTGIQNITWAAQDDDNDSLLFDIYLENSSTSLLLANGLPNETREWSWNTSMIPNGTYSIRIVARDDNPSIPLKVNATSSNFTIYHPPPPNHLPHVDLLSPPNSSIIDNASVHLSWKGSDLDGDLLTYTVRYSDNPQMQGAISSNSSTAAYIDLLNLTENKTYYWTVDTTDGKSNGTDIPTAIWSFTIKINHPPRITSKPLSSVQVGDTYSYNVTAADIDNNIIALSIIQAPNSISFNPSTGQVRWTPNASDVGNHTIIIQASDGKGGIDQQIFNITVVPRPPPQKPQIMITYPTNGSKIGGMVTIRGTAANGSSPLSLIQVRIDGANWKNAVGLGNWSISRDMSKMSNGNHKIEARAYDGNLYSDTATVKYSVFNPEPIVSVEGALSWIIILIIIVAIGVSLVVISQSRRKGPPLGEKLS